MTTLTKNIAGLITNVVLGFIPNRPTEIVNAPVNPSPSQTDRQRVTFTADGYEYTVDIIAKKIARNTVTTKPVNIHVGNRIIEAPGHAMRIGSNIVHDIESYGGGRFRFGMGDGRYLYLDSADIVTIEPGNHLTPETHS